VNSESEVPVARVLARGDGWTASEVVCHSGPHTRPFEERHGSHSVALVVDGTFQYRSGARVELMTPGSILLGNSGQPFECAHDHGVGDRCVSFSYQPGFFDELAFDLGSGPAERKFKALRLPPVRVLAGLTAWASAPSGDEDRSWEEVALRVTATALQVDRGIPARGESAQPVALARVTRVVRMIEAHPEENHSLAELAASVRLSPYHFLRTFEALVGVTPHQYVLRMRLRKAAMRLCAAPDKVLDIALDSGFQDVSNFNRTFRAEFGLNPREYRLRYSRRSRAAYA